MDKEQEIVFIIERLHLQAKLGLWDMVAKSLQTLQMLEVQIALLDVMCSINGKVKA